ASRLRPLGSGRSAKNVVAIGISTGGPNALSYFLPKFPADFQAGILIVQHMPAGFTEVFAKRLDKICRIEVKEAADGDVVIHGRALVAPGGKHLKIKKTGMGAIAMLSESSPVNGHRPSADVLFHSVAREYGKRAIGVIMTGMGEDGAEGIGEMKRAGARTIAQDEPSSVVFGMPRVAIERGYVEKIASLDNMAEEIIGAAGALEKDNGGGEYAAAK
ncbi:MAG: CheB methylesterase domain-containing protein, partial [Thermodesulfobacteriota bacterium]